MSQGMFPPYLSLSSLSLFFPSPSLSPPPSPFPSPSFLSFPPFSFFIPPFFPLHPFPLTSVSFSLSCCWSRERYVQMLDQVAKQMVDFYKDLVSQRVMDQRILEELHNFKNVIQELTK